MFIKTPIKWTLRPFSLKHLLNASNAGCDRAAILPISLMNIRIHGFLVVHSENMCNELDNRKISSSSVVSVLLECPFWLIMLTSICAVFLSLIEIRLMVQRLSSCGIKNRSKAVKSTEWVFSHIDPQVSDQWLVSGCFENHTVWMSNHWIICLIFDTKSKEEVYSFFALSALISSAPFPFSLLIFSATID